MPTLLLAAVCRISKFSEDNLTPRASRYDLKILNTASLTLNFDLDLSSVKDRLL